MSYFTELEDMSACPLCHKSQHRALYAQSHKNGICTTMCCKSCGLVHINPIPSQAEIERRHSQKYLKSNKRHSVPKRIDHVRMGEKVCSQIIDAPHIFAKAQTVLDVGAGSGAFSAIMLALGKKLQAVEPRPGYAGYLKRMFDVDVFCGSVVDFKTADTFDLVRFNHVLEHMRDPVATLRNMRSLLSENGVLYVETLDFVTSSKNKRIGQIFDGSQIYHFDHETLRAFAAGAGLKPVAEIGATRIYFTKCEPFEALPNAENATRNITLHAQHIAGEFRPTSSFTAHVKHKLFKAINEIITVRSLKTPHNIIRHYSAEIERLLNTNTPPRSI